jgi:hypothetical protein
VVLLVYADREAQRAQLAVLAADRPLAGPLDRRTRCHRR